MRNARRSNQQLTRTSANRARVFEFMERFSARHLYTIDGPPDTDLDEIMAFAYEGGVAVVHTFEGGSPLWTLYTEPSVSGDLDELERAMRLQIDERQAGADAPQLSDGSALAPARPERGCFPLRQAWPRALPPSLPSPR